MVDLEFENIWKQYQAEQERERAARSAAASVAAPTGVGEPAMAAATAGDMTTEADPAHIAAGETGTEAAPPTSTEADIDQTGSPSPGSGSGAEGSQAVEGPSSAGEREDALKADYRGIAERRVRLGLLLAEVGRSNNITVTQDELNQAITREARRHPGYERQVLDFYRQNPEAVGNLRAPIFEDKVIDFIVELAKVEERKISPQELLSTPDPDEEDAVAASGSTGTA
jgi:hypothetical protein